jgi:ribosome-associated protein
VEVTEERLSHAGLSAGRGLVIPWVELELRRSRSGGPGGQHVNKVETKVEVRWDVAASPSLDERRRARLLAALATRLVGGGVLVVRSSAQRSQGANRRAALERLAGLVEAALKPRKARRPTAPTAASRVRRVEGKKRRSSLKRGRVRPDLSQ